MRCPNCKILINSGKCPKCEYVRRSKNLAGKRIGNLKVRIEGETMAKNIQSIKEFERQYSGYRIALVRIRSRYTIAEWNYYLKKWVAGDGYAFTPDRAVETATYNTLLLFRTQKDALCSCSPK